MVAAQHVQAAPPAQGIVTDSAPSGPRPEVLARLAAGVDSGGPAHPRSDRARMLGLVVCAVIAVMIIGIVLMVGYP